MWVNGALVGHRPYGYTDFAVSIGEHLRFGEENVDQGRWRPSHDDARWYSGAGHLPDRCTSSSANRCTSRSTACTVTTPTVDDDGAVVAVATVVENESLVTTTHHGDDRDRRRHGRGRRARRRAAHRVPGPRRDAAPATASSRTHDGGASTHPTLYTCRTVRRGRRQPSSTARVDDVRHPHHRGRPRARPAHQRRAGRAARRVHPPRQRRASARATIPRADERRVEILKEAGFNALRSAHHPMSREMLDACDRLGMLVMDEAFDMWTEPKMDDDYAQAFPDWWQADVDAMVRKDRNHPSRDHVLHRQRDPRHRYARGRGARARHRRADPRARRHPARHQLDQPVARVRARAVRVARRRARDAPPTAAARWASTR